MLQPRRRCRAAGAAVVCLSIATGTLALWACGPFFPNWIFSSDRSFLEAPGGLLRLEIQRLKLPADPFHAQPGEDPFQQTADAEGADLQKAMAKSNPPDAADLIARHAALRKLLKEHAAAAAPWQSAPSKAVDPLPGDLAVPGGLPGEMADYLQGAVAWHQGRFPDAAATWQRLLHRPAAERRLRSTWAAFMLGKAALRGDRKEAVRWFETTRELAAHGFEDSLGLAAASLGWQARAERDLGHFDRALALYARQARSGDPLALSSLQLVCRQALAKGAGALNPVARSADARDVMTAFLVSDRHGTWESSWPATPEDLEAAQKASEEKAVPEVASWLKAVKAAGVKETAGADRLAWAAYQGGDFASSRDWVKRAPDDAPLARWIRAKLLLRDGKVAEAQKLLDEAARTLPPPDLTDDERDTYSPFGGGGKIATPSLAFGEDGALLLTQGQYAQALDRFLHGGFWLEAAYVAERVMALDELRAYVDATWPPLPAESAERARDEQSYFYAGEQTPPPGKVTRDLRYLLGRRLVRAGRLAEAKSYLPASLHPLLAALAQALATGRSAAVPAAERARTLFQAACITRRQGMEIAGTEDDPDWTFVGGSYELDGFAEALAKRAGNTLLVPAADEKERSERNKVEPWKRFHYRYHAAGLARDAAALLPDGSEDKARLLATAGSWLKARDPEAAGLFYKSLVSCCRTTRLGKEAERLHHLPETPECAMGVPEPKP